MQLTDSGGISEVKSIRFSFGVDTRVGERKVSRTILRFLPCLAEWKLVPFTDNSHDGGGMEL